MNTLVIAVAYRTPQEAVGFAKSLLAGYGGPDLHLIIVDNSDVAGEAVRQDDLPSGGGRVELVLAPANLGYFGGAELGLATHLRRHEWPDWVVVCNVDLTVEDPAGLLERLRSAKATGVVAPRIIREDTGRDLNPFMRTRPSAMRMWAYAWLFRWYPGLALYDVLATMKRKLWRPRAGSNPEQAVAAGVAAVVYAPHGSFFCLSREFFRRGGTLRYEPFLFGEEIHIAEQARRMALSVTHDPRAVVLHRANASMRLLRSRVIHGFVRQSSRYIAQTYFGRGSADSTHDEYRWRQSRSD